MALHLLIGLGLMVLTTASALAAPTHQSPAAGHETRRLSQPPPAMSNSRIDHSGREQRGRASYYGQHFAHRKTASGARFNPNSNAAASKTLPLGTVAKVTNLSNGRSALVRIEDRGPFGPGRVVDVTPKVADQLAMRQQGTASVVVAPIAVPQADGAVKLGAGAVQAAPQEVDTARQQAAAAIR